MEEGTNRKQDFSLRENTRLLGICVRARSFGFVVIEDRTALDCGVRTCDRPQFDDCLGDRFERLLRTYHPSAVIVLSARSKAANHRTRITRNSIRNALRRNKQRTIRINPTILGRHFVQYQAATKDEIASIVAQIFPELAWRLPRKRKPWESEHYSMSIFTAAAAVIAYVSREQ